MAKTKRPIPVVNSNSGGGGGGSKSALDAKRGPTTFYLDPDDIWIIGLDTKDGAEHPQWDERIKLPLDERLIASISKHGVIEPVKIYKDGPDPVVWDGRQRVKAAREINRRRREHGLTPITIRCLVATRENEESLAGMMVAVNEIKQADTIEVKVAKAKRLEAIGMSTLDIACEFGVTVQTITTWLKFGATPQAVQEQVASGNYSMQEAVQNAELPHKEQKELAKKPRAERGKGCVGAPPGPRKPTIKRVMVECKLLHPEFLKALMWVCGDIDDAKAGIELSA